ncbi:hypothetical protein GCM10011611_18470 [Aliidongia dinghuensis]|uniref:Uncharacterized protein n=1 Tax=Aliidongia dinghuensis TaxID=1867774 RepID=A0A8J3E2R5_9PROT|nr:hypothetical protein [Aliidongia dinghuensis]GGF13068.1 hypothetical protein GCM10011611_18470 [Aliidongia dinghuensis]
MSILLIAILTFSVLGIVACLALRGPLIRAAEERHGLTDSKKAVTDARKARVEAKGKVGELEVRKRELSDKLAAAESEAKKLDKQLKTVPQMVYTLVFELGGSDTAMPTFEFIVSRTRRSEPGDAKGPERELWSRPRIVRARSRNLQTAIAAALARFPTADGFTIRPAERVGTKTL